MSVQHLSANRSPAPSRQRSLSVLERSIRRDIARHVLAGGLPDLVAELVEAASDDLTSWSPTDIEAQADAELRVVEAVEYGKAVLDAVGLEALARLRSSIESGELARVDDLGAKPPAGWLDADRLTVLEVTTATGLGPQEVHDRLALATDRAEGSAELRRRLRSGTVSLHRARVLHDDVRHLDGLTAVEVIESVLRHKDGAPPSPTLFRQRLTRACLAADHEAALRRRRSRRRRGAFARIDADGLGVLTVTNDADKIVAAMERADALARAARLAGDTRALDVLRADAVTDLLVFGTVPSARTTSAPSAAGAGTRPASDGDAWTALLGRRPAASVSVVVPLPVALGTADVPCEVPGYGWVDAEQARRLLVGPDSRWRIIAVDAATGIATGVSTNAYRPTAAIRAVVEAVDGTCRGPGCTVPAARCDLDHDIPWPHGPTDRTNLTSKHREHHNARTHGHWDARRDEDARVHWRTAAGRRYVTGPKDWLEDLRPTQARPPQRRPELDAPPPF
ncbi:HNH endonuclease signature motif containing protein [Intrasporangium flavum]|uniref:HNH endonuclease signature motif containing protein n=1 Tax=Intrasporangium flavum TaxID=1428657 RepID=UPI00096DC016|nr:HNH endonuclease signature motif containing protein [Intrasporangium flavum]